MPAIYAAMVSIGRPSTERTLQISLSIPSVNYKASDFGIELPITYHEVDRLALLQVEMRSSS